MTGAYITTINITNICSWHLFLTGSIRNYEQDQREPLWDAIFRLTSALGVSSEAFRPCVDEKMKPASVKKPAKGQGRNRKGG